MNKRSLTQKNGRRIQGIWTALVLTLLFTDSSGHGRRRSAQYRQQSF